jgi:ATP/maltotriose-dependent transcriptional regulator MalT
LLARARGDLDEACRLAGEARRYAEERGMRNHYPLTALVEGQVLAARGDLERGLEALGKAEREALDLGMQPIAWQARLSASEALASAGNMAQSQQKRAAARAIVEEIAGMFNNETLREAYIQNMLGKVG